MKFETMSNPQDYPCTSKHQEKCKLIKAEPEWEAVRTSPSPEPRSSSSGTTVQPLVHLPVNFKPKCHGDTVDENIGKPVDMSRTRDDVRTPASQDTCFLSAQRSTFSKSSASQRQNSNSEKNHSSRFCSSCLSGNLSRNEMSIFGEGQRKTQPATSLAGDNEIIDQLVSPGSSCTNYIPELATEILQRYGLEKDDMEDLLSYPEDQITADKLPLILQLIRIAKEKKMTEKSERCSEPQSSTSSVGPEKKIGWINGSIGTGTRTGETLGTCTCTGGTIGTGAHTGGTIGTGAHTGGTIGNGAHSGGTIGTGAHTGGIIGTGSHTGGTIGNRAHSGGTIGTGSHTGGIIGTGVHTGGIIGTGAHTGGTIGARAHTGETVCTGAHSEGSSLMDTYNSSHCKGLQPKSSKEVKSSGLVYFQETCTPSLSSFKSSAAPSTCDPTDQGPTQLNLNLQKILYLFPRDTDTKFPKLDASKGLFLEDIKPQSYLTPKDQTLSTVAPGPLVLDSGNHNNSSNDQIKTQEGLKVESKKNQQSVEQQQLLRDWYQTLQHPKPPVSQMEKRSLPQEFSTLNPASSSSVRPRMVPLSPCQSPQIPRPLISPPTPQSPHSRRSLAMGPSFMGLPPPAMMEDYAATPPETFPHTCSLCNTTCASMKNWILHQNMSFHLEHCKLLRIRYPKWDGNISPSHSFPDKHAKQVPPVSARQFQHQDRKSRSDGCFRSSSNVLHHHRGSEYRRDRSSSSSRSLSPLEYHDSEGRRRKSRSRSGESRSSRCNYRSRSRSPSSQYDQPLSSRYRSRSRSRERRSSSRREKKKRSSKRRSRRSSAQRASDKRRKSSKRERLTKKLLKTSALQSLMEQPKLKAVVKTLVPVVLSELKKMKTSAASSSASCATKKQMNTKCFKSESNLQRSASISTKPQDSGLGPPSVTSTTTPLQKSVESLIVSPQTAESSRRPVKTRFLPKNAGRATTSKLVSKAKLLVSKAKGVSVKQVLKTFTTGTIDGKGSTKDMELRRGESKLPRSKKSKCPAESASESKQKATHKDMETNTEESSNEPTTVGKPSDMIVINSIRVKNIYTEVKVFPSEAEPASATQILNTPMDSCQSAGDVKEEVEEKTSKVLNPPSKSQPDAAEWSRAQNSEENIKEPELLSEDKAEVFKTNSAEVKLDDLDKVNVQMKKEVETLKLRETEVVDVDKGPAEDKGCKLMETKTPADTTSEKGSTQTQQPTAISAPETVVKASLQENRILDSESSGPQLKTSPEGVEEQEQTLGRVETNVKENVRTREKNASKVDIVSNMAAKMEPSPSSGLSAGSSLTVGEKVETEFNPGKISCLKKKTIMSSKLASLHATTLLVTNLPEYYDGCYCEDDVANLLCPFGFVYKGNTIYIIPQKRMAFALMCHVGNIQRIIRYFDRNDVLLKGSKLSLRVMSNKMSVIPFEFYSYLMKMMHYRVKDDGSNTVFIHNISQSEAKDLRATLKKICPVKNYLPLLNKVFVQFKTPRDADLLGVLYSALSPTDHHVYRLKIPQSFRASPPPKRPATAFADIKNIEASVFPTVKCGVAQCSSPFWITMRTTPFVFPTFSPWFNIPNYHTARGLVDIEEAAPHGSEFSTIMLTSLPQEHYTHEDIAKLVWCHFPKQNLHSLYYNVVALPLQRRAFVFFSSWKACCDFVLNHIKNPVWVGDCELNVHFVLEDLRPGFSEETMYRSVMKWSNAPVSELRVLEERLLCVEVSETSAHIVMMVMKEVASVAPFVNFLPLANRIVVEMSESSGVAEVVEKIPQGGSSQHEVWCRVKRIEASTSLTQRLQDRSETVKLEPVGTKPASVKPDETVWKPKPRAAKTAALSKIRVSGSSFTDISNVLPDQRTFWSQQSETGPSEGPQSSVTAEKSQRSPEAPETSREALRFSTGDGKLPECISESKTGASQMDPPARIKEMKTIKEEDDGKEEEIFNLVEFVEQKDKDGSSGTPGPDGDQVLHQGGPHGNDDDQCSSGETTQVTAAINQVSRGEEETTFKDDCVQQASATQSSGGGHVETSSSPPEEPDEEHKTVTNIRSSVENQQTIKTSTSRPGDETTPKPEGPQKDGAPTEKWTRASHRDDGTRSESESDLQVVDSPHQVKDGPSGEEPETSPPVTDDKNQSSNEEEQKPPETNDTTAVKYVPLILEDVTDEEEEYYLDEEEFKRQTAPKEELMGEGRHEEVEPEGRVMETLDETTEPEVPDEEEEGGSWLQSGFSDEEKLDGCLEEGHNKEVKVTTKHQTDSGGPTAKRFCSEPPGDMTLIPSSCKRPLGQEFVERRWGFFCSLCSVFYLNTSKTKDEHCCSRAHYDNLKTYFQKHQLKLSGSTESRF